ncbi:MAG: hypothetical protein AAGC70_11735 [Pseudomonadota bacterium]
MVIWTLTIGVSVALLIVTAAARGVDVTYGYVHMGLAFGVALVMALTAIREVQALERGGASPTVRSATLARYMALVWIWGALALAATYLPAILTWKEWAAFFGVFAVLGGVSMFLSWRLSDPATATISGASLYSISRYLAMGQFIGMLIVMIGLVIDGKMTRFLADQAPGWQDWAANNYFFFGAMALAIISAYGLRALPKDQAAS